MTLLEECRALLPGLVWEEDEGAYGIRAGCTGTYPDDPDGCAVTVSYRARGGRDVPHGGGVSCWIEHHVERVSPGETDSVDVTVTTWALRATLREAYAAALAAYREACAVKHPDLSDPLEEVIP